MVTIPFYRRHKINKIVRHLVLVAVIFVVFFSLSGCVAIRVYDCVPEGMQKGYVKFYAGEGNPGNLGWASAVGARPIWHVYEKMEDELVRIDEGLPISSDDTKYIAKHPGTYTYVIKVGTFEDEVTVDILDGMVTPVNVVVRVGKVKHSRNKKTIEFSAVLNIEEPHPAEKEYKDAFGGKFCK